MRAVLLPWLAAVAVGLGIVQLQLASPGLREAGQMAGVLVGLIGVIVAVAAGVCFLVIAAIDRFGKAWLARSAMLHVAWHLLRSQQATPPLRARLHARLRRLARPPSWGGLAVALAAAAGAALLFQQIFPWARWVHRSRSALWIAAAVALGFALLRVLLFALLRGRYPASNDPAPITSVRIRRKLTLPTFISVVGTAVGVWALIVVLSVMRGFGEDLRRKILQVDAHVHLESAELDLPLPGAGALLDRLRANPNVQSAHPLVVGRVILSTPYNVSASVDIKGVDPWTYGRNPNLARILRPGLLGRLATPERLITDDELARRFEAGEPGEEGDGSHGDGGGGRKAREKDGFAAPSRLFPGIILGSELAESLQAQAGQTVQLITPEGEETPLGLRPRTRTFRVAGTFHTGMYQYDLRLAFVAYWEAARLFEVEGGPNRIEVVMHDPDLAGPVAASIRADLPEDKAEVRDWRAMNRALISALALERTAMFIMLGFIILVASFNIVGSQVLIIMEKAREIAILRAVGGSARWVARAFLTVGAFIGVIGIGTGLGLGLLTCGLIHLLGVRLPGNFYLERLPVEVDPFTVGTIVLVAAAVTLAASIYPTLQAAKLNPSEGLRHE